jgi:hypothetical protein
VERPIQTFTDGRPDGRGGGGGGGIKLSVSSLCGGDGDGGFDPKVYGAIFQLCGYKEE